MGYDSLLFSVSPLSGTLLRLVFGFSGLYLFRLVSGFSVSFTRDFICGNPKRMGVKPIPSEKVCFGLLFPYWAALTNRSLISVVLFRGYIQAV